MTNGTNEKPNSDLACLGAFVSVCIIAVVSAFMVGLMVRIFLWVIHQ